MNRWLWAGEFGSELEAGGSVFFSNKDIKIVVVVDENLQVLLFAAVVLKFHRNSLYEYYIDLPDTVDRSFELSVCPD